MDQFRLTTNEKIRTLIPIFGWLFLAYGLLFPMNYVVKVMWWIDIVLSATHFVQIFVALPLGKKAGISALKTACLTVAFGSMWWKPLQNYVGNMK